MSVRKIDITVIVMPPALTTPDLGAVLAIQDTQEMVLTAQT